jgi:hypothetical protein
MSNIELFEQLANHAHYHSDMQKIIQQFPIEYQSAIQEKSSDKLKSQLAGTQYLANESHVVRS